MSLENLRAEIGNSRYAFQLEKDIHGQSCCWRIDFECKDMCDNGTLWVEGAYGNMKIYNKYHNASPIYLFSEDTYENMNKVLTRWCDMFGVTNEKFNFISDRVRRKMFNKHADKIIDLKGV